MTTAQQTSTPTWKVAGLWMLVTVPALWGFYETLMKGMQLFTG